MDWFYKVYDRDYEPGALAREAAHKKRNRLAAVNRKSSKKLYDEVVLGKRAK